MKHFFILRHFAHDILSSLVVTKLVKIKQFLASFLFLNIELLNFYFLTSRATFPLENILQENKLFMAVFVLKLTMCHIFIILNEQSEHRTGRTLKELKISEQNKQSEHPLCEL